MVFKKGNTDRTVWGNLFGKGYGIVARQNMK
jgi:hypothetical protein